jgi:hypothetical protein
MEEIKKNLKKLKDDIYNLHNETNNEDFTNLVKLSSDMELELYETLILLHSNYKSELQEIKKYQIRTLNKIIDNDIEIINKLKNELLLIKSEINVKKKNNLLLNTGIFFIIFLISIIVVWVLYTKDSGMFVWLGKVIENLTKVYFEKPSI